MIDPSLRLLMRLRVNGALRKIGRQLRTPKGVALSLFGLLIFVPMLLPMFLAPRMPTSALPIARQVGPILLLLYCVTSLLTTSTSERSILFTPAEVHFLFSAPFTQRQLLAYKVAMTLGTCALTAFFMALFLSRMGASTLSGVVGLVLSLCFLQLFGMFIGLAAGTIGILAHSRRRRVVLIALGVVAAFAASRGLAGGATRTPMELWASVRDSVALRVATFPFRPFSEAYAAERAWPDLAYWGGIALLIDLALLVLIFLLDARYLEAAEAQSAKTYAMLEKMRASGGTGMLRAPKKAGVSLPMPPFLRGAGPVAWRQMTTSKRDVARILLGGFAIGIMLVPTVIARTQNGLPAGAAIGFQSMLLGFGLFLGAIFPYDFRADLDRMAELKVLPIGPRALALGQLATPVLVMTGLQWAIMLILMAIAGSFGGVAFGLLALALPLNLLVTALDNLWFLLFPSRPSAAGALDLQHIGRSTLQMIVKFATVAIVGGLAGGLGYGLYALTGSVAAAMAGAWLIVAIAGAATLVPIADAFDRFDVARDAPE